MATTRAWALKGNIANAINYILDLKHDQKKTVKGLYTYTSVDGGTALSSPYFFKDTRRDKKRKEVGYHFQFSLPYGEGDEKSCLELAKQWFEEFSGGEVDYVLAVHNDRNSIHAHIVANSYKKNGDLWRLYWIKDNPRFRNIADRVCKEHGFSTLDSPANESQKYFEWLDDRTDGNRTVVKKLLDELVSKVTSYEELTDYLRKIGFKVYDDEEKTEAETNTFVFTADIKLIQSKGEDGKYTIRIPYTQDYIRVDPEEFEWIKEGKTARITIPVDKNVNLYSSLGEYNEWKSVEDLKKNFEDKTKSKNKRKGLRIKPQGARSVIRTAKLGKGEYSREYLKYRIMENGRKETDPKITQFLKSDTTFNDMKDEQRRIFADSGIRVDFESSSMYKSLKQENYYKWKAAKATDWMQRYNYKHMLEKDRKNLDVLKSRCGELQKGLKEIYQDIEKLDATIDTMMKDKLENTMKSDIDDIDNYIEENRVPLETKKEEIKKQIRIYTSRIERVEKDEAQQKAYEKEKQKKQRVRERVL